ncbi:WD40-repeat-containing domain protein [Exophiala viscosa]|uniref:WD40-repeat-containing domain protein n=1 Tax=Exophiala viscosa TaxID=2486360 RepID=UPI002196BAA4|nr:WD40-repeat-containing domain protein [Exophiala viscosa]
MSTIGSHDPGHYFQTDTSLVESDRKQRKAANTKGSPVKFPTKILAVEVNYFFDPSGDVVFLAEASGSVSGLRLSTNEVSAIPRGAQAPLTCLAYHATKTPQDPFTTMQVFAGGWDKSVWNYTFRFAEDTMQGRTVTDYTSFPAHRDFVKCLIVVQTPDKQDILITGGADGDVRFWSIGGQPLGSLNPNCRGIEALALDPLSDPDSPGVMFSTSKKEIFSITVPEVSKIKTSQIQLAGPIVPHETSVYKLHFDDDGDLWTASADKTAKQLSRNDNWQAVLTLEHPDFVRDVVTHDDYGWVLTACRDEEVRVWFKATGDLHHVFSGHYEEVTGLTISNDLLISVSIDGTLRRWSLAPADLQRAVEEMKHPHLLEDEPEPKVDLSMLTEEEEAELRALMESEEQETLEKMVLDEQ